MVHAVKSVHAWHSHHILLLRDPPSADHTGSKPSHSRQASRRGATAVSGDSLSNALQWFQNVTVHTTDGSRPTTTEGDDSSFLASLLRKVAFMMAES